uniref:Uncharacterized protein n=1 Tax=Heterorhabditis bacteriophora TaxID=37862 RepID=A0A1I7WT33_HETBA
MLEKQNKVENYYTRGRHNNVDCFYISQNYIKLPKNTIQENANLFIIFPQDQPNLSYIYRDHCGEIDKNLFIKLFITFGTILRLGDFFNNNSNNINIASNACKTHIYDFLFCVREYTFLSIFFSILFVLNLLFFIQLIRMESAIRIKMFDKTVVVDLSENMLTLSTIKRCITRMIPEACFVLPDGWQAIEFFVETDKAPSRPVIHCFLSITSSITTPITCAESGALKPVPNLLFLYFILFLKFFKFILGITNQRRKFMCVIYLFLNLLSLNTLVIIT